MASEYSESDNPYEKLSPAERQQELRRLLAKLPYQLTQGEPQIVENVKLLNELTKLLQYQKGNPELIPMQLRDAAYASEFGVEALRETAELSLPEEEMFPGTLLVDVGVAGQFEEETVQIVEKRELLRLGKRRATKRASQDHFLFVKWSVSYEKRYHQKPNDPLPEVITIQAAESSSQM